MENSFPVNWGASERRCRLSLPLTGGRGNVYNDNGEKDLGEKDGAGISNIEGIFWI